MGSRHWLCQVIDDHYIALRWIACYTFYLNSIKCMWNLALGYQIIYYSSLYFKYKVLKYFLLWILFSFSKILLQKEELEQKHLHLVQIVESEKTAKWQYTQQCEELTMEIKKLRNEVWEIMMMMMIEWWCWWLNDDEVSEMTIHSLIWCSYVHWNVNGDWHQTEV